MTSRRILSASALASGALALGLLLVSFQAMPAPTLPAALRLYAIGLALMQAIFSIWYFKGAREQNFALWSGRIRAIVALVLATCAASLFREDIPQFWQTAVLWYAAVEFVLGTSLILTNRSAPTQTTHPAAMTAHYRNRFFFALYMIVLAGWIMGYPGAFVGFFHLPETNAAGETAVLRALLMLFSAFLLQLALFNLVAVRYRIAVLIEAGVRGGLVTSVVVAILVVFRLAHPLVLLIPAVDLISIAAITLGKLRQRS